MPTPNKDRFVNPPLEDVAKELAASSAQNEFDLPPEALDFAKSGGKVLLPEVPIDPDPFSDPQAPTQSRVSNHALTNQGDELDTELTDDDRDAFAKAVLFDQPFERDISMLDGKLIVSVRTLSEAEEEIVTRATRLQEAIYKGENTQLGPTSMMLYVAWIQRFKTLLRVVQWKPAVSDVPNEARHMPAFRPSTAKKTSKAPRRKPGMTDQELEQERAQLARQDWEEEMNDKARQLVELGERAFKNMNPSLYMSLITAVRVHELKFSKLASKAASRNFWQTGGTN